jgi:hypothetical protein
MSIGLQAIYYGMFVVVFVFGMIVGIKLRHMIDRTHERVGA